MHSDFVKMIIVGAAAFVAIITLGFMHVLMVPKSALPQRRKKQPPAEEQPPPQSTIE
jgi:hypothetical protein